MLVRYTMYKEYFLKNIQRIFFILHDRILFPSFIPRLELLGCLLLTELIDDVERAIAKRIKIDKVVCWTDLTVALRWIKGKEKTWKVWVENRVVKIRKVVPRENWFHVTGVENPADTPTRAVEDFVSLFQGIWFSGPPFLLKNEIDFPELCNVRI